jgi:serine/threonine protein kinase
MMPFAVGQNVGPYRILEQLGQGGMATVYKAYHAALDRFVAMKVLHTAFREDATFLARFTREARVVAKLEHPHIVPIFDYSECDGQPYLVMKYIEGETLKARLQRSPLGAQEAIVVVEAVGSALAYAHSKGILHRDIKPSNILLTPDGYIYLADFGLARIAQSTDATLSSDMLVGTPHYISPEQAQGLRDLDAGTDIYSFGVVMYEIAVGRVPFNADTPFSIIHDHIFTPLPLPHTINPKVPDGVERVLLKALAKERGDRFASVDELVHAFVAATRTALGLPAMMNAQPNPSVSPQPGPVAMKNEPAATSLHADSKPESSKLPPKKGFPWWGWLAVAMASCLCLILFVILLGGISSQNNKKATETAAALLPEMALTSNVPTAEITLSETSFPADSQEGMRHFAAGIALANQGEKEKAAKEFQTALELVPASRTAVLLFAVGKLKQSDDWVTAGSYCIKGLDAKPNEPAFYNRVCDEVIYHIAGDSKGNTILLPFQTANPDLPLANAAYGRWLLEHTDQMTIAKQYIDYARTRGDGSNSQIVRTVVGEYQLYKKDTQNGISTLNGVIQDPNSPPWLKAEAQRLINAWS